MNPAIRCTYFYYLQLDLYCAGDTNVTKEKLIAKSKLVAETKAAEKKSKKSSQREIISEEDLSLNSAVTSEQSQKPTLTFAPPMPHLARAFPKKKPEPKVSTARHLVREHPLMMSDFRGVGGSEMTPKDRTLESKNRTLGGDVRKFAIEEWLAVSLS